MHRPLLVLLAGLLLAVAGAAAMPPVLDVGQTDAASISLSSYFSVLDDPDQSLGLAGVRKPEVAAEFKPMPSQSGILNLGLNRSAHWLRITLKNSSDQPIEKVFEIAYSRLSHLEFHRPTADGNHTSITTGSALPHASRLYKNRGFVFPLVIPPQSEQNYFLRIASTNTMFVPALLWTPEAYRLHERNDYQIQAWYFGIASAMILFNLLLFFALRDLAYLHYVNFAICATLTLAAQTGLAKEFFWPDATVWSDIAPNIGYSLSCIAWLQFMRNVLGTRNVLPRFDWVIKGVMGLLLLTMIGFVVTLQPFIRPAQILYLVSLLLILGVGSYCAMQRQRIAYFFVGAFFILCLTALMVLMTGWGLLPPNMFAINAIQLGSTLEMMLLALALADRFNVIRKERLQFQTELVDTQQQLIDNLRFSEQMLEARVDERTRELQTLNSKLAAMSTTDGLTGIANRRRFDEILASEWSRAARLGHPLALAMIDVDWFKKYNDRYGHQAGDDCLRMVARVLAENICRTGDLVARYGGEEFAFIAPATDGNNALIMARHVCEALQALAMPHELSAFGCITASAGVAAIIPDRDGTPDMLVKAADEALYYAKGQGRNQAVLAMLGTKGDDSAA